MNVFTRGVKNALRSPLRSGAIVLMLAISIGLILSMLVARSSVATKINEVKATTATTITINPAGVQGGFGGGNPLTTDDVATITKTAHVATVVSTLTDQLATTDTNLTPSLSLGSFGARLQRFSNSDSSSSSTNADSTDSTSTDTTTQATPTARTSVTGTSDPSSVVADSEITSGTSIGGTSSDDIALVGTTLAAKNSLKVGDTFTAYGQTITVKGIFDSGNTFQNSGIIMPLATVQTLTSQPGDVSSVVATADSSDNVASTVKALTSALGTKADITSEQQQATDSVASLQGIESLTLAAVIGSAIAGAIIVLLAMIMIVRERRREIGVIKAIGGTNGKVIAQFMIEGITLTIIGAIVGLGLGILVSGPMTSSLVTNSTSSSTTAATGRIGGFGGGATSPSTSTTSGTRGGFGGNFGGAVRGGFSQLRTNLTQVTASLTPQVFLIAIGITLLIAIIGSAVPAWFIARIRPAEVLRTE